MDFACSLNGTTGCAGMLAENPPVRYDSLVDQIGQRADQLKVDERGHFGTQSGSAAVTS